MCIVDKKSLIDLGILPSSNGEWPLRELLDHTHSKSAHYALESLLANPLNNLQEIAARQQLLRALTRIIPHLNWMILGDQLRQLSSYLDSNFIVFPNTTFDGRMFALRYPEIAKSVEQQVLAAGDFFETCATVQQGLAGVKGDARFREVLRIFENVLNTTLREEIRAARDATSQRKLAICQLDCRFRIDLREQLLQLIEAFYVLDAYCALALATQRDGLVEPRLILREHGSLCIEGLHHPVVKGARPNNIGLQEDQRVMFLTGPNMSGKSTLLRALGICVVLAHLGVPVPATRATIPLTDRVIASLGNEDNILRAESLYLAEVRRVKSVVAAVVAGEMVLALLDEVFRGTNVKDASDATTLLVSGLSHATYGLFAISSHLTEVAERMNGAPRIGFWHLEVVTLGDRYKFSYALVAGVSHVRMGFALLKSEGVVDLLEALSKPPHGARNRIEPREQ